MLSKLLILLLLLFLMNCSKEEKKGYSVCNSMLACNGNENSAYCTFGYKWGAFNPFPNAGVDKPGPSDGPVEITYTFIDEGYVFSTHSQTNLTSKSYNSLPECTKDTIRQALAQWEKVAAITFTERVNDPTGNIRIMMGTITQGGVGFPSFPNKPCSDLSGQLIIQFNPTRSCEGLYILVLHEIGHVLGLGHVQSNNVMNPDKVFTSLQPGDIEGITSIYGRK